jgi:hypothetical protein
MKRLTKAQIKRLLRADMETGLSHLEAMASVTNAHGMYASQIEKAAIELLIEDM